IVRSHWRTMNEMTLSERFKCVRQISATDVQRDDGAVLIAQLTNSAPSGVGDRIIDQFKFLANDRRDVCEIFLALPEAGQIDVVGKIECLGFKTILPFHDVGSTPQE